MIDIRDVLYSRYDSFTAYTPASSSALIANMKVVLLQLKHDEEMSEINSLEFLSLMDVLTQCCQHGVKLLIPAKECRLLPLISAAYNLDIIPLRLLVRNVQASHDVIPLPFNLSSALRPLESSTVHSILMCVKQTSLLAILPPATSSCPGGGATWLGLFRSGAATSSFPNTSITTNNNLDITDMSECDNEKGSSGDNDDGAGIGSLLAAVGVSESGHVWVYRAEDFYDWKKIAGVLQCTLAAAACCSAISSTCSHLMCIVPEADEVINQALLSTYGGFSDPSSLATDGPAATCASRFDCLVLREDVGNSLARSNLQTQTVTQKTLAGDILLPIHSESNNEEKDTDDGYSHSPHLLYLLAGQSNMSGRGRLSDLVQHASPQHPRESQSSLVDSDEGNLSPFLVSFPSSTSNTATSSSDCETSQEEKSAATVTLSPPYARRIKAFDAKAFCWVELDPMRLHSRVDYVRDARFGPAVTFATHLVELLDKHHESDPRSAPVVGLVSAAVGATFLEEWSPAFRHRDSSGIPKCKEGFVLSMPENANYQPEANRGCFNLLSCAMRSFFGALLVAVHQRFDEFISETTTATEIDLIRSMVGGLLWSQGENDSIHIPDAMTGVLEYIGKSSAETYERRLGCFISDIRWCMEGVVLLVYHYARRRRINAPRISMTDPQATEDRQLFPVVCVAVTGTRPWMKYLPDIRRCQLEAPSKISNLLTVDSLGSFLKTDCVHLTTEAAISVGQLLAKAMYSLSFSNRSNTTSQTLPELRVARSCSFSDAQLYEEFSRARHQSEMFLNNYYSNMTKEDRKLNKKGFSIFDTDLKAINFVYGEIHFQSILRCLRYIDKHRTRLLLETKSDSDVSSIADSLLNDQERCFVDLGCGAGAACAAGVLSGNFSRIVGIDLMYSKIEACRCMISCLDASSISSTTADTSNDTSNTTNKLLSAINEEKISLLYNGRKQDVQIVCDNFLKIESWSHWHVVYIASTVFAEDQMPTIFQRVLTLPQSAYLVLLDKQLPNTHDKDDITKFTFDCFELVMSCQCESSWGTTMTYVYHKYA